MVVFRKPLSVYHASVYMSPCDGNREGAEKQVQMKKKSLIEARSEQQG